VPPGKISSDSSKRSLWRKSRPSLFDVFVLRGGRMRELPEEEFPESLLEEELKEGKWV